MKCWRTEYWRTGYQVQDTGIRNTGVQDTGIRNTAVQDTGVSHINSGVKSANEDLTPELTWQ